VKGEKTLNLAKKPHEKSGRTRVQGHQLAPMTVPITNAGTQPLSRPPVIHADEMLAAIERHKIAPWLKVLMTWLME
jgi:hypothetical protein